MRGVATALALVVAASCGSGTSPGTGESDATTGATTTTDSGGTQESTTSSGSTGAADPCTPAACAVGAVGCPCRGEACDDGDAVCDNGRCIVVVDDMVRVPAGAFCMGCNATVDDRCVSDELPAHTVVLSTFDIDRTEVTQAAYAECVTAGECPLPSREPGCANAWDPVALADHPVACIDWDAASSYCAWLGRRLPTEAEWEMAARGVEALAFPWGDDAPTCELANFGNEGEDCIDASTPVGSYPAGMSPYGAFDMSGNVWERVVDWYASDYYASSPTDDPSGPDAGSSRVLRGGGFTSFGKFLRASARDGARAPWVTADNLGFRCARTPVR